MMSEQFRYVDTSLSVANLLDTWGDIKNLGLVENIAELDALGYTVITPERFSSHELTDRLLQGVLDTARDRWGLDLTPEGELPTSQPDGARIFVDLQEARKNATGATLHKMLGADPVFEEALLNPVVLAMASYLCGHERVLSVYATWIKPSGTAPKVLHCDGTLVSPTTAWSQVCACQWLLTDFSCDNGATCYVPGSHRFQRQPAPGEGLDDRTSVEAPRGSLIVWHGNTWHGSTPRLTPGLRISLNMLFCRPQLRPFEDYSGDWSDEEMAEKPERLRGLLGERLLWGIRTEGLNRDRQRATMNSLMSVY